MQPALWTLTAHQAQLRLGSWTAAVDLDRPERGLHDVCNGEVAIGSMAVLGVALEPFDRPSGGKLIEAYVRGGDLVATYAQTPERPVRVQVYWRAGTPTVEESPVVTLQISVQTSLLDIDPTLQAVSTLAATEVQRLNEAGGSRFAWLSISPPATTSLTSRDGTGCLLFRLPDNTHSYAEMIHPADFTADALRYQPAVANGLALTHQLFAENLEKGVILRARIRGLFTSRQQDEAAAQAAYQQLCSAAPPLTT